MVISILRAICVMVALSASSLGAIVFDVYDLGTLHTESSYASDINDSGQICGGFTLDGKHSAFVFSDKSGMQILDIPEKARPRQLNEVGQIIGSREIRGDRPGTHAFFWDPDSGFSDLGTLGGSGTIGYGLNNHGQVVGSSRLDGDEKIQAFIWSDGVMTPLESPGDSEPRYSYANTIDDEGHIAGTAAYPFTRKGEGPGGVRHKLVVWDHLLNATEVQFPFKTCGASPVTITKSGCLICLVCRNQIGIEHYAINIKSKETIALPARGITNDQLTIVTTDGVYQPTYGWFGGIKGWKFHKFQDCVPAISDKNTVWEKISPSGINNKNEIVGVGTTVDGETHAVILRPRK